MGIIEGLRATGTRFSATVDAALPLPPLSATPTPLLLNLSEEDDAVKRDEASPVDAAVLLIALCEPYALLARRILEPAGAVAPVAPLALLKLVVKGVVSATTVKKGR